MTNVTDEQISNLMDNEWDSSVSLEASGNLSTEPTDALIRTLQSDEAARQKWARYHLMRDVMQNDYTAAGSSVLGADFASKVASAIEAEPAIVAFPASNTEHDAGTGESAAASPISSAKVRPAQNWRRNFTGLAVAASVAMVSVVGLNLWRDSNQNNATQNTVADNSNNAVLQELTAGAQQLELVANRGTYWKSTSKKTLSTKNEEKLNMFLSRHIENAPTAHTGMFPYSRLVGYDKVRD